MAEGRLSASDESALGDVERKNREAAGIERMPAHVAVIMDGNGRWAQRHGLPRSAGHREGAKAVRAVVTRARELGLPVLTLYAFSAQNWVRPESEVAYLMDLLIEFCHKEQQLMLDKEIRLRMIGDRAALPPQARFAVESVERLTASNSKMQLVIAVSYGGREELVRAARQLADDVADGVIDPEEVDADAIQARLWTSDLPDPDLLIRTSGELRVSNFLLWQIAYSEIHIASECWPDFDAHAFDEALRIFAMRERRFGGLA